MEIIGDLIEQKPNLLAGVYPGLAAEDRRHHGSGAGASTTKLPVSPRPGGRKLVGISPPAGPDHLGIRFRFDREMQVQHQGYFV